MSTTSPTNVVFILSDEHSRDILGCYGNRVVRTPNIDRLAAGGTLFENAYTNCPICIPARASLATGRYVHETRCWDNGLAYSGTPESWGHQLLRNGYTVDSIGKLHYRSAEDDVGFGNMIDPLNVVEGVGDILGCIREDAPYRKKRSGIEEAGPGDSTYLGYDRENTHKAIEWIRRHANDTTPWVLFLGYVLPHPPYIAPPDLFHAYRAESLPMPPQWRPEHWPRHPTLEHFRDFFDFSRPFTESHIRDVIAAYYACCTYLDSLIGRIIDAVAEAGLNERTRIVYTSDHGEDLGARGLFGKFTMYEESCAVPMIISGPDIPVGRRTTTPVSLVDIHPTIIQATGCPPPEYDASLPGRSLLCTAAEDDTDRIVFSEYHAVGSENGFYMVRDRRYKYVYYVDGPDQLFDLDSDPRELQNLTEHAGFDRLRRRYRETLFEIVDPETVDARAKKDQEAAVQAAGGRDKVIRRGAFDNSPVPGEEPQFHI